MSYDAIINEILGHIQGSCADLEMVIDDILEDHGMERSRALENAIYTTVDNTCFLCERCGWWTEVGYWNTDLGDEGNICLDCEPMED